MSIVRVSKRDNPFVQIDKTSLDDVRLSWKAKGLLAYLLSKPDDWEVRLKHLEKQSKDGRDSVATGMKELIECGYCQRSEKRLHDEDGLFTGFEYTVYETPYTGFPYMDKPYMDNPHPSNNDSTNNDLTKSEEEEALAKLSKLYENNLGMITPVSAEWLRDAVDEYPADWFEPALKEMLKNNVRTWNYWEAILKRWKRDGFQSDNRKKSKREVQSREQVYEEWLSSE